MIRVDEKYLNLTATLCNEVKQASFELSDIAETKDHAWDILEVGCGTGNDALTMARMLPNSHVIGIDYDPELIEKAKSKFFGSGLTNVEYQYQNLYRLNSYQTFDLIRVERVIQHLPDVNCAFDIFYRCLKNKGRLTIVDSNWAALHCAAFSAEENEKIQAVYTDQLINKINQSYLISQFERIGMNEIESRVLDIGLSVDDYLKASRFVEVVEPLLPVEFALNLKNKLAQVEPDKVIGKIEMVVATGIR